MGRLTGGALASRLTRRLSASLVTRPQRVFPLPVEDDSGPARLIERCTPYEISEQLAFRGGHMRREPGKEPAGILDLPIDE